MRYSKVFFVLALSLILVFAGTISSFSTSVDWDLLRLDVEPSDSAGYIVGTPADWYHDGTSITLTAFPYSGYVFKYWMIDVDGDGLPTFQDFNTQINFTLKKDTKCTAYFERVYDLSLLIEDSSMGTVSGTAPGKYPKGAPVAMTATPNDGYRVVEWLFNGSHYAYGDTINFNMPKDNVAIKLILEEIPWFEITTFVEDEEDWGTVTGAGTYQVGDPVTLTATPARGYVFDHWDYTWCPKDINTEEPAMRCPPPPFDSTNPTITFPMKECDGEFTAYFSELSKDGVILIADPEGKGLPELDENALRGDEDFDGYYYYQETYNVIPNPIPHWHFVGYSWRCIGEPSDQVKISTLDESPYMSTDPNYDFYNHGCNTEITVYYEEDHYVMATIKYLDANDLPIKPETEEMVYIGAYTFAPPAISGYTFGVSSPNASGTITDESEDFIVIHKYYIPQVITNTNTVTETVFVQVPATTEAPTEAITEEVVPLGVATILDFDELYVGEEPVVEVPVIVEEEETPLADALPQTGQLPVELFYGLGGLVSTLGIYIRRRK